VFAERFTVKKGAKTLVHPMCQHGAFSILVSGGSSFFARRVAENAGFHDYQAKELVFAASKLTGQLVDPILGRAAKAVTLNRLCELNDLSPADVLAVAMVQTTKM